MAGVSSAFSRAIQGVKPHVPLIKFRKGGQNLASVMGGTRPEVVTVGSSGLTKTSSGSPSSGGPSRKAISRPIIEDYQLPYKYRRQPLDDSEINAINSGGAFS